MVFGAHWFNAKNHRVDLDLSTVNIDGKIGWDSMYRNDSRSIMFSGDITDAPKPKGAMELFYISGTKDVGANLLYVNYYNFTPEPVDYKIVVSSKKIGSDSFEKNYMLDVSEIIMSANLKTSDKAQQCVGLVNRVNGENRFYFTSFDGGNSRSSRNNELSSKTREFFTRTYSNPINLEEVLVLAGAQIVRDIPEEGDFIDLSPETLDKNKIIDLFTPER